MRSLLFLLFRLFFHLLPRLILGPTFLSSRSSLFTQLAVCPLDDLKTFFLSLGTLPAKSYESTSIGALTRLRRQRIRLFTRDRKAYSVLLSDVPVSHTIEVHPAVVVCGNLADFLAIMVYFAPTIILFLPHIRVVLIEASESVFLIDECHLAFQLMGHRAKHDTCEAIVVHVPANLGTIIKMNLFKAKA